MDNEHNPRLYIIDMGYLVGFKKENAHLQFIEYFVKQFPGNKSIAFDNVILLMIARTLSFAE